MDASDGASVTAVDTFGEEWFSAASQKALGDLCDRTGHLEGDVVEIGCWTGRSTVALANACYPGIVHAVDTWEGSPGEISADLAAQRDVFGEFRANIDAYTAGNVVPHRMGWRDYLPTSGPIRFLHIDAEHTYVEVRDNIAAALPLLVPGAILCGDDVHHPPVQEAVIEAFGVLQPVASLWWVRV